MRYMIAKQRGMTFLGVCFIFAFIAIVVLFTLRVFPLYNEKFQVTAAMNTVSQKAGAASLSTAKIRRLFQANITAQTNIKKFNNNKFLKETVSVIKPKKKSDPKLLNVKYSTTNPLVLDIQLLLEFNHSVPLNNVDGGG